MDHVAEQSCCELQPLVTVIVPVYKVENYLGRCVRSIINQTYTNLEIYLVDDGSPDRCPSMCDEFAKQDSRVRVIHKKNGGLSSARNAGIDASKGEYIIFVDSDDYIEADFIEAMIICAVSGKFDIVICGINKIVEGKIIPDAQENGIRDYSGKEALAALLKDEYITSHSCNKLFTKEVIGSNCYPEGRAYEDLAAMPYIFLGANRVMKIDRKLYNYCIREDSISFSVSPKQRYDLFLAHFDRMEFAERHLDLVGKEILDICRKKAYVFALFALNELLLDGGSGNLFRECYMAFLKKERIRIYKAGYLNIEFKIKIFLISVWPWIYERTYMWRFKGKKVRQSDERKQN